MKIVNVKKRYGEKVVLDGVTAEFPENEVTAILGESGAGKSTLLGILAGTVKADEGTLVGVPERVSYVFQEERLIPTATVEENLKWICPDICVSDALSRAGLSGEEKAFPASLSKGMAKRISLLRAFYFGGDLMLLDEPFQNLDVKAKTKMQDFFLSLKKEKPFTAVLVTHDIGEAVLLAKRILILKNKRIERVFDVSPENRFETEKAIRKLFS